MGCGGSKMSDDEERKSSTSSQPEKKRTRAGKDLDENFKPINILVYKNGDKYDVGSIIPVTRRRFRNWLSLLEHITKMIKGKDAVHKLYNVDGGKEARHFKDLEDGARYVAVYKRLDKSVEYGTTPNPKWAATAKVQNQDPKGIDSGESHCMYLQRRQFRPTLDDMWEDSSFDLKRGGGSQREEEKEKESTNRRR